MSTTPTRRGFLASLLAAPAALFALSRVAKASPSKAPFREYDPAEWTTIHVGPPEGQLWRRRTERFEKLPGYVGVSVPGPSKARVTIDGYQRGLNRGFWHVTRFSYDYGTTDYANATCLPPLTGERPIRDLRIEYLDRELGWRGPAMVSWWEEAQSPLQAGELVRISTGSITVKGAPATMATSTREHHTGQLGSLLRHLLL